MTLRGHTFTGFGRTLQLASVVAALLLVAAPALSGQVPLNTPPPTPGAVTPSLKVKVKAQHERVAESCVKCHKHYGQVTMGSPGLADAQTILKSPLYKNRPELVTWAKQVIAYDKQLKAQRQREHVKLHRPAKLRSPKDAANH